MPIFDQYEVEPMSAYSGSSAANYVVLLTSSINIDGEIDSSLLNKRVVALDKASNQNIYFNSIIWDSETYLNLYFRNGYPGRVQRNLSVFSNETIYDSIPPSPLDIHTINGGVPVYNYFTITATPNLILTSGENLTASNDGRQISDNTWLSSYPFQSKYKNAVKYFTPTTFTNKLEYFLYPNWGASIEKNDAEYRAWKYNTGPFSGAPPYDAPIPAQTNNIRVSWLVTSQSYPYNSLAQYNTEYSSSRHTNNNLIMHFGGKRRISPSINSFDAAVADKDILDDYFGFGNATPAKNVGFNYAYPLTNLFGTILTGSNGSYISNWAFSNIIRGFKYGLYSANQENTKCTYRLGRYGQFRDMLEGRPTVASLVRNQIDPYTNQAIPKTLFYPMQVAFLSGTTIYNQSKDYVTATNPSYNPYDSGIYDIYYRSGQPFFDRDNED